MLQLLQAQQSIDCEWRGDWRAGGSDGRYDDLLIATKVTAFQSPHHHTTPRTITPHHAIASLAVPAPTSHGAINIPFPSRLIRNPDDTLPDNRELTVLLEMIAKNKY
uniref:Uncharacterized protein n=1 Tax=Graphocephala atropunctata TaxID=36148 RepID=A0A1B6LGL3_9HEMI